MFDILATGERRHRYARHLRDAIRRVIRESESDPQYRDYKTWNAWEKAFDRKWSAEANLLELSRDVKTFLLFSNHRAAVDAVFATEGTVREHGERLISVINEALRIHRSNEQFLKDHPKFSEWVQSGMSISLSEYEQV